MTQYLKVDNTSQKVLMRWGLPDPADFVGPPTAVPDAEDGITWVAYQEPVNFSAGRPTPTSVLAWQDGALGWLETASLDEMKERKNADINSSRLAANFTSFMYKGHPIACDTLSRGDIDGVNGYVTLTGTFRPSWKGAWKTIDNTYVAIATIEDWKAFYAAMVDQGQANFDHAQALKAQLASATTAEQISAITWSTPIPAPT